ncbi:MAG TPA: hypothetical protein DCG12_08785 [Planctomycetaceae bacterium]|nr:hypothetical protein [Planctomycetaceae bacterium]
MCVCGFAGRIPGAPEDILSHSSDASPQGKVMRAHLLSLLVVSVSTATYAVDVKVEPGAVNQVLVTDGDHHLAVYGWNGPQAVDRVLLTHGRRDVVWRAESLISREVPASAPEAERSSLATPQDFWSGFSKSRYHDYGQQSTRLRNSPLPVDQWVTDGDSVHWRGHELKVISTPGFTRGSVSYLLEDSGRRVVFTGDLIYGDGQLFDLYSFQDAIPEAQVRGYHGYGGRLAALVDSLKKVAALKPDLLIPARGPVIRTPAVSLDRLKTRVQKLYQNYLSTNALHWYFKKERMTKCGERVLGAGAEIELMPYSQYEKTPSWVFEKGTSRLLISDTGRGFLLDCGSQAVINAIEDLQNQGAIEGVDGIFVTHYHDDHTDYVQAAAEKFKCPVYATKEYSDVLENPEGYHLPAMTSNAIANVRVVADGHQMKWHEYQLTFRFFPGQTWYHGALFVRRGTERPIFFVGDAFAPSGIDDYCVLNRNLLHDDSGYLNCIQQLRAVREPFWLVNEHIPYVFSFSKKELDYIETRYRQRIAVLSELSPWNDPNYMVDEQWAVMYPRGTRADTGQSVPIQVRLINHSGKAQRLTVKLNLPTGAKCPQLQKSIQLGPRESGRLSFDVTPTESGRHLVTADIAGAAIDVREWTDVLIETP